MDDRMSPGSPVLSFINAWLTLIGNGRSCKWDVRLILQAEFACSRGRSSTMVSLCQAPEASRVIVI
jgi:hypothetical protein